MGDLNKYFLLRVWCLVLQWLSGQDKTTLLRFAHNTGITDLAPQVAKANRGGPGKIKIKMRKDAERCGSYRVETPGSNPIHGSDFIFPYFSTTTSPGAQCLHLRIIVNSKQVMN